ncbi:MAG: hypothetical protein NWE84_07110 [Candidatus Bathyarchaeota archaeon]|nr:hypothetical protein [Candidatus Bathyarchaeota archaeon]
MTFSAKRLLLLIIIVFSSMILLDTSLPLLTKDAKPLIYYAKAAPPIKFDLESDQSFSGSAGSIIEYNVYLENRGKSDASFTLSALSDKGYYIEIWRDTDQIGSGDLQLFPPQGSTITLSSGEVATLIVKVIIPSDATDGTVDNTIIKAEATGSGASDFVTISTTVTSDLPWPSSWIQLGSDPNFPTPPSERIDIKASYYTNNGTHVFSRTTEVSTPNTQAFEYLVYLDTMAGGQEIDGYSYDYLLSSGGILYVWDGTSWLNSGYPTYVQTEGTAIVLWTDLENIVLDTQEIHFLTYTATKDGVMKDKLGPYTILTSSISEFPFILFPLLGLAIYLAILRRNKKECAQT